MTASPVAQLDGLDLDALDPSSDYVSLAADLAEIAAFRDATRRRLDQLDPDARHDLIAHADALSQILRLAIEDPADVEPSAARFWAARDSDDHDALGRVWPAAEDVAAALIELALAERASLRALVAMLARRQPADAVASLTRPRTSRRDVRLSEALDRAQAVLSTRLDVHVRPFRRPAVLTPPTPLKRRRNEPTILPASQRIALTLPDRAPPSHVVTTMTACAA